MSVIPQPPQFTCAIWLAAKARERRERARQGRLARPTGAHPASPGSQCCTRSTARWRRHGCTSAASCSRRTQAAPSPCLKNRAGCVSAALTTPRGVPHTPAGGTGVMLLHCASQKQRVSALREDTTAWRAVNEQPRLWPHAPAHSARWTRPDAWGRESQQGVPLAGAARRASTQRTPAGRTAACHTQSI